MDTTIEISPEEQIEMAKAEAADQARDETVASILIDLEDWATEFTGEQLEGFRAAIQVIRANY